MAVLMVMAMVAMVVELCKCQLGRSVWTTDDLELQFVHIFFAIVLIRGRGRLKLKLLYSFLFYFRL